MGCLLELYVANECCQMSGKRMMPTRIAGTIQVDGWKVAWHIGWDDNS
jgi:hypothetical protein